MKELILTIGLIVGFNNSLFAGPLLEAVRTGDINAVKVELNKGADVNEGAGISLTPLWAATSAGHKEVVILLLKEGADVNAKNKFSGSSNRVETDYTAIFASSKKENKSLSDVQIMEILINSGANLNTRTGIKGETVLHSLARSTGSEYTLDLIDLVISKGASVNAISKGEPQPREQTPGFMTPLDIAKLFRNNESASLLRKNGGISIYEILEKMVSKYNSSKNPTGEWPRKIWEIEFNLKEIYSAGILTIANDGKTILVNINGKSKDDKSGYVGAFLIRENGDYFQLTDSRSTLVKWSEQILFMNNDSLVVKENKTSNSNIVTLFQINNEKIIQRKFEHRIRFPPTSGKGIPQNSHLGVQIIEGTNKLICWDFTPPSIDSDDQGDGNNGGNTVMSRLSIGISGPDISIGTDGKLGGPAELQKSSNLKNWKKIDDLPSGTDQILIKPGKSRNEFFRLKKE